MNPITRRESPVNKNESRFNVQAEYDFDRDQRKIHGEDNEESTYV